MRCPFTDERYAQILKKVDFTMKSLGYHASHEKGCFRKEVCFVVQ